MATGEPRWWYDIIARKLGVKESWGWKCPGCERCYSPDIGECRLCNAKSDTTLSTGVELGCWANPAGDSLPPSNLTVEEVAEIIGSEEGKKIFDELMNQIDQQASRPNIKLHIGRFY